MPTQCKPLSFAFQGCQRRRVTAAFDGGTITSNAGALLLRQADRSTGLFDRVSDEVVHPCPGEAVQLFRAKLSTGSGSSRPGLSGDREGVLDMDGSGVAGGGGGLLG